MGRTKKEPNSQQPWTTGHTTPHPRQTVFFLHSSAMGRSVVRTSPFHCVFNALSCSDFPPSSHLFTPHSQPARCSRLSIFAMPLMLSSPEQPDRLPKSSSSSGEQSQKGSRALLPSEEQSRKQLSAPCLPLLAELDSLEKPQDNPSSFESTPGGTPPLPKDSPLEADRAYTTP